MVRRIVVETPLLETGCQLGEGSLWVSPSCADLLIWRFALTSFQDERRQKLYFVDIEGCKIYSYDPSDGVYGYQSFDRRPTALALLEDDSGVSHFLFEGERLL